MMAEIHDVDSAVSPNLPMAGRIASPAAFLAA